MKLIEIAYVAKEYADYDAIFFTDDGLLIEEHHSLFLLPLASTVAHCGLTLKSAHWDEKRLIIECSTDLSAEELLQYGLKLLPPKNYFLTLQDQPEIEKLLLRTAHWSVWNNALQFCNKCAAPLEKVVATVEKKCPSCEQSFFPKLSPAILVLIQRGDEILLGRGAIHPPEMYTALAGFIDLGESAEDAVHREVREEVDLEITNLKYFGSQSWPFPDSFMIAFKADYLSGTINIDPNELEDACWFHRDHLPELPPSSTLSRQLIESFIESKTV